MDWISLFVLTSLKIFTFYFPSITLENTAFSHGHMQGLTGRVFQVRVGYGSGIGKKKYFGSDRVRIWYGYWYRILSHSGIFGYFLYLTYLLYGMSCKGLLIDGESNQIVKVLLGFCALSICGSLSIDCLE